MSELTITHTPAAGTRLTGATIDDASCEVLLRAGWRLVTGGTWHLPASRGRTPRRPAIEATAERLRRAGVNVTIEIGAPRPARATTRAPAHRDPAPTRASGITQADVRHGDEVQHSGQWLRAIRVNKHTVTTQADDGRVRKLAYSEISAARQPETTAARRAAG
ncbi:hypothetical protein [Agromyces bauzanensis]